MKVAISGAGVAGPALAYWLHRNGHDPTLIERAPQFRTGGYVIDFWGVGYRVAQRMGLEDDIRNAGYQVQSLRSVGQAGQIRASLSVEGIRLQPQAASSPACLAAILLRRSMRHRRPCRDTLW